MTVAPGSSIQAAVDANPTNTVFLLAAGRHVRQRVTPKAGQQFFGALGTNGQRLTTLDGEFAVPHAIYMSSAVSGVKIVNLIIANYSTPSQLAMVGGYGMQNGLIENCEIRNSKTGGVSFGSGTVVRGNNIHHNEQTGFYANGAQNAVFENNELAFNNWLMLHDYGWEAGGSKFLKTKNMILRGNYVHDNHGQGLWGDHNNVDTIYENNRIINNVGIGIFHEISFKATIRNNYVENCGFGWTSWVDGSGILVNSSQNVEIHSNTVVNCNDGICATNTPRGAPDPVLGAYETRNLFVHHNTIVQPAGIAGGIAWSSGTPDDPSWNNRYQDNIYDVPNPTSGSYWTWSNGSKTWAQWRSFGHDVAGIAK